MIAGVKIVAALVDAGVPAERVSVQASNVVGSPYPYVYVFLSEDGIEGRHLLISALSEWEDAPESTMIVGTYADYEAEPEQVPAELPFIEAVMYAAKQVRLELAS